MPLDLKPMRFAHSEGQTDVCYDDTGRYLITCGSDGDVRVYDSFDDDDPESFSAGETVTAVRFKNDQIITGSDNAVQIYKFPEGTPDGLITRFAGSVNHIEYSSSGKYVAAGGSDFNIKVVDVGESYHKFLKGHEAPVLSLAFDPDEEFVASSSCDGTVKIWDWKEQNCLQSLNLLPKSNDINISEPLCRLAFQPNGKKYLAIPVDKEIKIYERATWSYLFSLKKEENTESQPFSIVAWSPCGKYLAAASLNGEMIFWHFNSKNIVERTKHDKSLTISCLVWNPKQNGEIAYTDNQGQLGICSDVIPKDNKLSAGTKKIATDIDDMNVDELLANDDNASETDSLLGVKKRHRVKSSWFDEEADENDGDDDDDDENTTDLGKIKAELAGPMGLEDEESNQMMDDNKSVQSEITKAPTVVIQQPQIIQQQPFQPGSTPVHLMHRFMVWNYVGIIRCHSEDEPSSIDIEFHDTSLHHSMHVVNHMSHTMAALSETAVLLACQAHDELPSKLLCLHFGTWDRSKEWSVSMPQGEDILAVAVGKTWAAVATNHDILRIFTIGGLQTNLVCLPGSVVCMSGRDHQLIVVYHNGSGAPGHQCLATKLIDIGTNTQVIVDQRLPLSPKTNLSWLGFSVEGTPATADSLGVVRLLNRSFDNTWTPVANTKSQVKRPSDSYWVIGLTESSEQIRCILCTGSTYPPTLPRPLPSSLPLQLPVCEMTTEKGQLEESYLRSCLLGNRLEYQKELGVLFDENQYEQNQTLTKQLLMKLFALSCKSDRDFRAIEICEFLPDAYSVSLAIKYASRNRHMNLAQRLDELARRKAEEEAAAEEQKEELYEDDEEEIVEEETEGRDERNRGIQMKYEQRSERRKTEDVEMTEEQDEEEYEEEEEIEKGETQENIQSPAPLTLMGVTSKPQLNPKNLNYNSTLSQETKRRTNPFKVSTEGTTTKTMGSSKGFFESLEKKKSGVGKNDKSPPSDKTTISKQGKQLKLFSKKKSKEEKKENIQKKKLNVEKEKEKSKQPKKPKVSAFQVWLEEIKSFLHDENPDMSETEIVKTAMKQWRETPKDEKQVWEKKARNETTPDEDDNQEEKGEKKRKRDDENIEKELDENTNEVMREEKENITKKVKTSEVKQKPSSKLAGFAFSKRQ